MLSALSELAEINPRTGVPEDLPPDAEVEFIAMGDVTESGEWSTRQTRRVSGVRSGFTIFRDGDVLFAKITPCMENGKGAHTTGLEYGIGYGSTEFHVLRAKSGVSARYIHHLCQSSRLRLAAESFMIGSAGQQRVQKQFFDRFETPRLPLDEQDLIARILDTLDTQIRRTEALIAKLEQIKQGLLTDLLTRGIDENGQLRPPPDQAPHLYKNSPLGRIPKDWDVLMLGDLLSSSEPAMRSGPFGSALLKSELVSAGIPLLGIDNVHVEDFRADFTRFVTADKFRELARYAVRPNDLMITIMGTVGRCCLVPEIIGPALSSKHTWTISLDQDRYIPYLAMLQVNYSPWVLQHFARDEQGGIMSAIRSDTLRSTRLPVPPIDEQRLIAARLWSISDRIASEQSQVAKLKSHKRGLMDDLLTGRVRVTPLLDKVRCAETISG